MKSVDAVLPVKVPSYHFLLTRLTQNPADVSKYIGGVLFFSDKGCCGYVIFSCIYINSMIYLKPL